MGKIKVKRKGTFIDMTAMSDVTVLLLTFFMLTSTILKKEPVKVETPGSVSEIKIPETNIMTVYVDPEGKVFLDIDGAKDRIDVLESVAAALKIPLTDKEKADFAIGTAFGVPMSKFKEFMKLKESDRDKVVKDFGIPTDSTNNEFKLWVKEARSVKGKKMVIAIKADHKTPYPYIKDVMGSLQDLKENRYNLITALIEGDKN